MFVSTKFAALIASATLALGAGAATASAQDFVSNGRSVEVYHGDLDLSKAADQDMLHSRITRAASRVCNNDDLRAQMACRAKTIANAQTRTQAAIARAATGERFADASVSDRRALAGN